MSKKRTTQASPLLHMLFARQDLASPFSINRPKYNLKKDLSKFNLAGEEHQTKATSAGRLYDVGHFHLDLHERI